ncbi:hypothetical protein MXD81_07555 [Microbacteriaceae bacterium K1510]|nr:hypothetical protein [Microbacteriaceae bacterium K1510]
MPVRVLILATLLLASQSSNSQAFQANPAFPTNRAFPIERVGMAEAPVGHRQPTLNDLPPWLRQQETQETTGSGAGQADQPRPPATDGMQQREQAPVRNDRRPANGVPWICNGC